MPINRILANQGIRMRTIRGATLGGMRLILIEFILYSSSKGVLLQTAVSHSMPVRKYSSDSRAHNRNDDKDNGVRNST